MKRILYTVVIVVLVLLVGITFRSHMCIQNIFDEMYYGHERVNKLVTQASYYDFGLSYTPDIARYFVENRITEVLGKRLLNQGETLFFNWILENKYLHFLFLSPVMEEANRYVFDIVYSVEKNTLYYMPLRIDKEGVTIAGSQAESFLEKRNITHESVELFLKNNFFDKLTNRWISVNGQKSRFNDGDLGELYIENHLWDKKFSISP